MLRAKTATDERIQQADPATRELHRLELAMSRVRERLGALAQLNPDHAEAIRFELDQAAERLSEVTCPLENLAGRLRAAWLSGELREPADGAD